jgi:hypothetical protein
MAGMVPEPTAETDEEFDVAALMKLLEEVATWPDTSVAFTAYTQDREGRSRWAVRVDWPLKELRGRLQTLLESDEMKKILKDVILARRDDGRYQLELPDMVLAVLTKSDGGTLIASADGLCPPEAIFGQGRSADSPSKGQSEKAQSKGKPKPTKKTKTKKMLVYCRLNLAEGEEGEQSTSPFGSIKAVEDVRFGMSLREDGQWTEKAVVRWHPLLGAALKMAISKLDKPFECPKKSYVVAALNAGFAEGLADSVADLPPRTIGGRAGGDLGLAVVPGNGFLPLPEVYFQFRTRSKDKIVKAVREAIEKDGQERVDEDRPVAWHEETVDGHVVFWRDPGADGASALTPATYRTVVFFVEPDKADDGRESKEVRLIVAKTPMWASDAVRHWTELMRSAKSRIAVPDSKQAHWQARINWRSVYGLLQPYLALAAGLSKDTALPPTPEELGAALTDSVVDIRIDFGGLQVNHTGPVPAGAVYVPAMVAVGLGATGDPSSEAERERVACRHLRVLYHHAKLFRKDYDRWPATVAELDGYVDFASHPELLRLRPKQEGFVGELTSLLSSREEKKERIESEESIDDSLYVIEWSPDEWKLKFRDGEFVNYTTIGIDAEERIVRVPKPEAAKAEETKADGTKAEEAKAEQKKAQAAKAKDSSAAAEDEEQEEKE